MPNLEFINTHGHAIQLKGQNGEAIIFKQFEKKVLSDWFRRYCPRYLAESKTQRITTVPKDLNARIINRAVGQFVERPQTPKPQIAVTRPPPPAVVVARQTKLGMTNKPATRLPDKRAMQRRNDARRRIGSTINNIKFATEFYKKAINLADMAISDNIGVGILSYNRLNCLQKLIESIRMHTNLTKTTVFVSDESVDDSVKKWLSQQRDIVVIDNKERIGIAGNTNRLMRCLDRFKYKIILNDDVEILRPGWEKFYVAAIEETKIHHFCMRQPGVHGATDSDGTLTQFKNCAVRTITKRPHGAVIAYDDIAFATVGFFDEGFGNYGMEHVDWSNRVALSGIQSPGFHDVVGAEQFFKIKPEKSAINSAERSMNLKLGRERYNAVCNDKSRIRIEATDKSKVPEVTYIVPFPDRRDATPSK